MEPYTLVRRYLEKEIEGYGEEREAWWWGRRVSIDGEKKLLVIVCVKREGRELYRFLVDKGEVKPIKM